METPSRCSPCPLALASARQLTKLNRNWPDHVPSDRLERVGLHGRLIFPQRWPAGDKISCTCFSIGTGGRKQKNIWNKSIGSTPAKEEANVPRCVPESINPSLAAIFHLSSRRKEECASAQFNSDKPSNKSSSYFGHGLCFFFWLLGKGFDINEVARQHCTGSNVYLAPSKILDPEIESLFVFGF